MYDYKEGQKRINTIINNGSIKVEDLDFIPQNENEFTFENGIKAWTCGLFVDIVDSTHLFKEYENKIVSAIIKAFSSEVITIMNDCKLLRDIGVRGDCIYGIFQTPMRRDIDEVMGVAACINTFVKALNITLDKRQYPKIAVGIGIGTEQLLIAKVGRPRKDGSDLVYFGSAIVNASKLSNIAGRRGKPVILIDSLTFSNLADLRCTPSKTYKEIGIENYVDEIEEPCYGYNIVSTEYNNWVNDGMKG